MVVTGVGVGFVPADVFDMGVAGVVVFVVVGSVLVKLTLCRSVGLSVAAVMLTVWVSVMSTSPKSMVPDWLWTCEFSAKSSSPSSVMAPVSMPATPSSEVITGASLVPVMVMVTSRLSAPPLPSLTVSV